MDDSTNDSVLDYNEFGYQLREKYPDSIDDFMVLDVDTSKGITDSYDQMDYLYERRKNIHEGLKSRMRNN